MPHIKIEKFDTSIFAPFEKDGVKFEAIADGIYHKINNDKKILASTNGKKFLLTIKNITSNDGSQIQMLKYDKVTRINPVDDIKKALNIFANHLEL
jgi:hypothetical protein